MDPWVPGEGPLISHALSTVTGDSMQNCIREFATPAGHWWWDKFINILPHSACLKIASIYPPSLSDGVIKLLGIYLYSNGCFNIKPAYKLLIAEDTTSTDKKWQLVWKWNGPQRIRTFLWLSFHDKLLITNAHLARRGLTDNPSCTRWCCFWNAGACAKGLYWWVLFLEFEWCCFIVL